MPQPLYTGERLSSPAIPANGRCSSARHLGCSAQLLYRVPPSNFGVEHHCRAPLPNSTIELHRRTAPVCSKELQIRNQKISARQINRRALCSHLAITICFRFTCDSLAIHLQFACNRTPLMVSFSHSVPYPLTYPPSPCLFRHSPFTLSHWVFLGEHAGEERGLT